MGERNSIAWDVHGKTGAGQSTRCPDLLYQGRSQAMRRGPTNNPASHSRAQDTKHKLRVIDIYLNVKKLFILKSSGCFTFSSVSAEPFK